MFRNKSFLVNDREWCIERIKRYPFASFILNVPSLAATHIPIEVTGSPGTERLFGHIAKKNDLFKALTDQTPCLMIFQGPDHYVSGTWYKTRDFSTWDYVAVHVHGELYLQSQAELRQSLAVLISRHEQTVTQSTKKKLSLDEFPVEYIDQHLEMIQGFWIDIKKMEGVAKLSQNKSLEDQATIVEHLDHEIDRSRTIIAELRESLRSQ